FRLPLALALLLAPATFICLAGGQNGFITAALLIGGIRLMRSHPILAGILFGVLTIKPQLGILLPFALLAARQWTVIASASLTTLALLGTSVLFFGLESWIAYVDKVVPLQTLIMNEGSGPFLAMMPSAYISLRFLGLEQEVRTILQGLMLFMALIGVVWTFARSQDWVLMLAALTVGTFMASPYAFNYDMTAVSFAIALLTLRALPSGFLPGERIALAMTWLLPIVVQWMNPLGLPFSPIILLACFAFVLLRVRGDIAATARAGGVNQEFAALKT
ncbi:MAG TPA: DUF2029 domain-containing protein, partial [Kiloniellaceae bacterium]|nr:DUF2029 domain-containing protein [Kiloniellaceae bacterium]